MSRAGKLGHFFFYSVNKWAYTAHKCAVYALVQIGFLIAVKGGGMQRDERRWVIAEQGSHGQDEVVEKHRHGLGGKAKITAEMA